MQRIPLPYVLVEQAAKFVASGAEPVEPRNAATVVLLRPGASEQAAPELYLMRRQRSMAFAGGMWVFPGGGVDARDADDDIAWAGPTPQEWAQRLGCDTETARTLVCAAVRETFEESGVLLAGPDERTVVADTTGDDWEADRAALESHDLAFSDLLNRRGLVIRTDLLGVISGWLTPAFEPRRFRTWFFLAALPQGQVTRDVSTESDEVGWRTAASALAEAEAGRGMMLPPTYVTCLDVARFAHVDEALADTGKRIVEMFTPELIDGPDGPVAMTEHPDFTHLVRERLGGAGEFGGLGAPGAGQPR